MEGVAADANRGGVSVQKCQKMIDKSLRTPMAKFLREHLNKSGCNIDDNFIKAVDCGQKVAGGYARGQGIMVNQVVIHELIHAYDDCRAGNLEWTNLVTGDCHYKRELLRGYMKFRGHEQDCVKRRVMLSLANNPYCSQAAAKDAMEAVWDVCYNDTQPFD
ncbi:hypothetical protein RND81_09G247800 [Saponaria officinalis]|uniref:Mitochondrial inner membrane protease ATP23 n=1 Tax=Saponaria officinalis TaxID=3572 RepID=A0AAW1IR26_SAPOF